MIEELLLFVVKKFVRASRRALDEVRIFDPCVGYGMEHNQ